MDKFMKQLKDLASKAMEVLSSSAKKAAEEAKKAAANTAAGATGSKVGGKTVSATPKGSSQAMRFPYTYTAKVVQFPWVYYFKNNWVYRYYFMALVLCLPIFKKISNVFNSPTNVAKWEAIKQKEREEEQHH